MGLTIIISQASPDATNWSITSFTRWSVNQLVFTPEAGGVSFLQLLDAIRTVSKANIVGADLNELAPMLDISGVSTATACKVLRELLIALDKGWPGFQV